MSRTKYRLYYLLCTSVEVEPTGGSCLVELDVMHGAQQKLPQLIRQTTSGLSEETPHPQQWRQVEAERSAALTYCGGVESGDGAQLSF